MNRWTLVMVLAVLLVVMGAPAEVIDTLENGTRIGPATTETAEGLVVGDPYALAAAAGVEPNAYALARCLASEHPSDPTAYLRCVAWAVKNKAAERGVTVLQLLTDGAGVAGDGYFGEQKALAGTKYASTRSDPRRRHVQVASEVIGSPSSVDPTGGATHFYSPRAQDALASKAAGLKARQEEGEELTAQETSYLKYFGKDAAYVDASWRGKGLYSGGAERVIPPGVDGYTLTLYRRLA